MSVFTSGAQRLARQVLVTQGVSQTEDEDDEEAKWILNEMSYDDEAPYLDLDLDGSPPKFLLPPPPLPDFLLDQRNSHNPVCDNKEGFATSYNLQHDLDTCDIGYVSFFFFLFLCISLWN